MRRGRALWDPAAPPAACRRGWRAALACAPTCRPRPSLPAGRRLCQCERRVPGHPGRCRGQVQRLSLRRRQCVEAVLCVPCRGGGEARHALSALAHAIPPIPLNTAAVDQHVVRYDTCGRVGAEDGPAPKPAPEPVPPAAPPPPPQPPGRRLAADPCVPSVQVAVSVHTNRSVSEASFAQASGEGKGNGAQGRPCRERRRYPHIFRWPARCLRSSTHISTI